MTIIDHPISVLKKEKLKKKILKEAHESRYTFFFIFQENWKCHYVKKMFWWPGMKSEIASKNINSSQLSESES
jgi:hypothetical protein